MTYRKFFFPFLFVPKFTVTEPSSFGLAALALVILHQYVIAKTEWYGKDIPEEWLNPNWPMLYLGIFFSLVSILISFVNIYAALALWLLLPFWVFFFHINAR